MTRIHLQRG
ncbi:hypothetical protein Q9233_003175 [Columba guinea]|nr:hypothetical protein Q9233_003175 [Columba guinea]